jgi:hypothetical protein
VALGRSELAPTKGERRFADPSGGERTFPESSSGH